MQLLDAAEEIAADQGVKALSIRAVADRAETSTRAVYSLFGSKEGLLVALGARAMELIATELEALPSTGDPVADLVRAGVRVFRPFAIEHPALFRVAFAREAIPPELALQFEGQRVAALSQLMQRVSAVLERQRSRPRSVRDAAFAFHAACEGLANMELRGALPLGDEERLWTEALSATAHGLGTPVGRVGAR